MFQNCGSIKNLELKDWDTSENTDVYMMFMGCTDLTSLNLANFNTKKFRICRVCSKIALDFNILI